MSKGFSLWFTGMSGSGKSTLANLLADELRKRGHLVEVLDGDEIRTHLSKGLGFSKEDRDTNIRRIGYVAKLLSRNGVIAISAAISPYRDVRDELRREHQRFFDFRRLFAGYAGDVTRGRHGNAARLEHVQATACGLARSALRALRGLVDGCGVAGLHPCLDQRGRLCSRAVQGCEGAKLA